MSLITLSGKALENACKPSKIGLDPHYDGIPNGDSTREGRIQFFLVGVKNRKSEADHLSRSTIFIKGSWKFKELFRLYHKFFHPHITRKTTECERNKPCRHCDSEPGCPQWLNLFNFSLFCEHYEMLLSYRRVMNSEKALAEENSEAWDQELEESIEEWYLSLPREEEENLPASFTLLSSDFRSGDGVFFMPGTVHWVMGAAPGSDRILFKAFFEVYGCNTWEKDRSGFSVSDGSFKKDARRFELVKEKAAKESGREHPTVLLSEADLKFPDLEEVESKLREDGLFVFNFIDQEKDIISHDIARYLEWLLDIPEGVDLTTLPFHKTPKKLEGLERRHLFRDPNNSRTSLFPKGHGNCGLGACSEFSRGLKNCFAPLMSELVERIYGMEGSITDICFGMQGPIS